MGYTTSFSGRIAVEPPLSAEEISYLKAFAESRRMERSQGPYHVEESRDGVVDSNTPPKGQPGLWCQWIPVDDGSAIEWDGGEKFYCAPEWMAYIRTHFVALCAARSAEPQAMGFLEPHSMNGSVFSVGEDTLGDVAKIEVDDQGVWISRGEWTAEAKADLFGIHGDDEENREGDDWPDQDETLSALAARPELALFEPRELVPAFDSNDTVALAFFEKTKLDEQLRAGSPQSGRKTL